MNAQEQAEQRYQNARNQEHLEEAIARSQRSQHRKNEFAKQTEADRQDTLRIDYAVATQTLARAKSDIEEYSQKLSAAQTLFENSNQRIADILAQGYIVPVAPVAPAPDPHIVRGPDQAPRELQPHEIAATQRAANASAVENNELFKRVRKIPCPVCGLECNENAAYHWVEAESYNCIIDPDRALAAGIISKEIHDNLISERSVTTQEGN